MEHTVVDVSKYQGRIDWNAVAGSGVWGAIIRAGYGRETTQKDPCFDRNFEGSKKAGLKVGVFWRSYAETEDEARQEARACLSVLGERVSQLDLPLYFDQEEPDVPAALRGPIFTAFAEEIRPAAPVGYYSYHAYLREIETAGKPLPSSDALWVADYRKRKDVDPRATWNCDMWQYTSKGKVPGIYYEVDLNTYYKEVNTKMDYIIIGPASAGDIDTLRETAEGLGLPCTITEQQPGAAQYDEILHRLAAAGRALAGEV